MSEKKETAVTKQQKDKVVEQVLSRVNQLIDVKQITLPENYSPENAITGAHLILKDMKVSGKPILDVVTKESVSMAIFKMVTQGLSAVKKHGSFIPYGDQLTWQREYAGNLAIAKRDAGVKDVHPAIIYKNDVFEYEIIDGVKRVKSHVQKFENINNDNIIGAYAVVEFQGGLKKLHIMSYAEIKTSWNQGAMKGNSPAHRNFPDQMCIKTVINRAVKLEINSSDDSSLNSLDRNQENSKSVVDQQTATEDVSFEEVSENALSPEKSDFEKSIAESVEKNEPANTLVDKDGQQTASF